MTPTSVSTAAGHAGSAAASPSRHAIGAGASSIRPVMFDSDWDCMGVGTLGTVADICIDCSQRDRYASKAIAPPAELVNGEWQCRERRFHALNPVLIDWRRAPLPVGAASEGGKR